MVTIERKMVERRVDALDPDPDRRIVSDAYAHLTGQATTISRNRRLVREGRVPEPTFLASDLRESWKSLKNFLGVESVDEIRQLAASPDLLPERREYANRLIAEQFEIVPKFTVEDNLERYALLADSTIDEAQADIPYAFTCMGSGSVVKNINHPVDLAVGAFTLPRTRDRIRALRKFLLMQTAAEVEFDERIKNVEGACLKFKGFIEGKVFDPVGPTDERYYMYSSHNTKSAGRGGRFDAFGGSTILSSQQLEAMGVDFVQETGLEMGDKLLPVRKRTFTLLSGETVIAYIPEPEEQGEEGFEVISKKSRKSIMIKAWRKNQTISKAVDDQVRMMVIFETDEDLEKFREHTAERAANKGSSTKFEEIEDTLGGGLRSVRSPGGSKDLKWYKAHIRMFGIRPEFIGLTLNSTSAADYFHGRNAHRRYELDRTLDSVTPRLIPPKYYGNYDPEVINRYARDKVEYEIRDPYRLFIKAPENRKN